MPTWITQRIAAGTWSYTKQGRVIDLGSSDGWDGSHVESASPIFDVESGRWALIYTGYLSGEVASLGIAWADRPEGPYVKDAGNPILTGSGVPGDPDRIGVTGCMAVFDSGLWHIYSIGTDQPGYEAGTPQLCYYTTPSLVTPAFTRHGVAIPPTGTGWRSICTWIGCVVRRGSLWYIFLNASGAPGGKERIGYATATSPAGPWTVDDVNSPVVNVADGTWESRIIGQPWVFRVGNTWVMEYFGFDGTLAYDGIATTTDELFPLGWTKYAGNPVLSPSVGIDAQFAHKPLSIVTPSKLYHFYTAVDADDRRTVALATATR